MNDSASRIDELTAKVKRDGEAFRILLLSQRQMLLGMVDAIERALGMSPRTAELRKTEKRVVT